MTHPHETPPQPTKHPAEDEIELYEETEDVPGELSSQDLMDLLADVGLAEELNEPLDAVDDPESREEAAF